MRGRCDDSDWLMFPCNSKIDIEMHKKRWLTINNAYYIYFYDDYFRQKCKHTLTTLASLII